MVPTVQAALVDSYASWGAFLGLEEECWGSGVQVDASQP